MKKIIKTCMLTAVILACPLSGVRKSGKLDGSMVRIKPAHPLSPKKRAKKQKQKNYVPRQEKTRYEPITCNDIVVGVASTIFMGIIGYTFYAQN